MSTNKEELSGFARKANASASFPTVISAGGGTAASETVAAMRKTASIFGDTGDGITRAPLLYVDPLFDPVLLMFPKENLKELYRRLRHYFTYNPIVKNIITLHSTFPFGDAEIRCESKRLEDYYADLGERAELLKTITQMSHDYELLGESVHFGVFDPIDLEWSEFIHLPPENVEIHNAQMGGGSIYQLKPDEDLRKKLSSGKPEDQAEIEGMDSEYKESLMNNVPWNMDANCIIYYPNKTEGYILRGDSPLKGALRYLLLEDKLYMAMLAMVDRTMFPIKIWKIGSKEQNWLPSKKHFDVLKQNIAMLKNDPDADILYHSFLEMEIKNLSANHEDLLKYFEWTQKRILMGLGATESMFAEANAYAKDSINIKLIMHRYMLQRATVNKLIQRSVYLPIAAKRGYIAERAVSTATNATEEQVQIPEIKRYIVPRLLWRPSNLVSNAAEREFLWKIRTAGELSNKAIMDNLGIDPETNSQQLNDEQGTPADPVFRDARKGLVNDIRTRNQILRGSKMEELDLPTSVPETQKPATAKKPYTGGAGGAGAAGGLAGSLGDLGLPSGGGAGRPPLPEEDKAKKPAIIPEEVMSPRDKLTESGELPAPKGEGAPII